MNIDVRIPVAVLTAAAAIATCGTTTVLRDVSDASTDTSARRVVLDPDKDYGDDYADGVLPVGDHKYVTGGAKKGYVYACTTYAQQLSGGGAGAQLPGPWFSNDQTTYDIDEKSTVSGSVSWPAENSITTKSGKRIITTNDLPEHTTGTYPISPSDDAYTYDRNPNSISAQDVTLVVTRKPTYGAPQCMGGQVGVMTTGAELFNAFDAGGRDAGAWEVQDDCGGHPQMQGAYHYHTLSACIGTAKTTKVIGWALDGFPITGPKVGKGNILTTKDLDVCHGITSKVRIGGKKVTTYHYVMTQDFPYSVSCFRATPTTKGPV
jgi:hypothetical protein